MPDATEATVPSPPEPRESSAAGGIQSVDRAVTVLEILAQEGSVGVSRVAGAMGVHKSTASRLLTALVARDLVQQDHDRGKYRLGFGIMRLAASIPGQLNIVQEADPVLEELADRCEETVNLAVLRSEFAVNVHQVRGPSAVAYQNWIGNLTPLHATSSGKVLLAALPTEERERILALTGLPQRTSRTVTERPSLEDQLLQVARDGVAFSYEELEIGLNAVAAPVFDHLGTVAAAVSISAPAFRFTPHERPDLVEDLRDAGLKISRRIGFAPRT